MVVFFCWKLKLCLVLPICALEFILKSLISTCLETLELFGNQAKISIYLKRVAGYILFHISQTLFSKVRSERLHKNITIKGYKDMNELRNHFLF